MERKELVVVFPGLSEELDIILSLERKFSLDDKVEAISFYQVVRNLQAQNRKTVYPFTVVERHKNSLIWLDDTLQTHGCTLAIGEVYLALRITIEEKILYE